MVGLKVLSVLAMGGLHTKPSSYNFLSVARNRQLNGRGCRGEAVNSRASIATLQDCEIGKAGREL